MRNCIVFFRQYEKNNLLELYETMHNRKIKFNSSDLTSRWSRDWQLCCVYSLLQKPTSNEFLGPIRWIHGFSLHSGFDRQNFCANSLSNFSIMFVTLLRIKSRSNNKQHFLIFLSEIHKTSWYCNSLKCISVCLYHICKLSKSVCP